MSDAFGRFAEWMIAKYGAKISALSFKRYLLFFHEVENIWGKFPTYDLLVNHFKPEGLRRVRRATAWLLETQNCNLNDALKKAVSEEARIEKLISTFPTNTIAGQALQHYEGKLRAKLHENKIIVSSIRLALTPAVKLLLASDSGGNKLTSQKILTTYLVEHPGQQAAITGFINHLNSIYGLHLKPKVDLKKSRAYRKKRIEAQLMSLITRDEGLDEANIEKWVHLALEYFHNVQVSKKLIPTLLKSIKVIENGSFYLNYRSNEYYIPIP
jgi:hypothetical protein